MKKTKKCNRILKILKEKNIHAIIDMVNIHYIHCLYRNFDKIQALLTLYDITFRSINEDDNSNAYIFINTELIVFENKDKKLWSYYVRPAKIKY